MFSDKNSEQIKEDIKTELPDTVNSNPGTFADGITGACAMAIANNYLDLQMIYEIGFAHTSWGEYLDMKVAEVGVDRKAPTFATGTITIEGKEGVTIATSSVFATDDDVRFISKEQTTIDVTGATTVSVIAEEAGEIGNVVPMSISKAEEVIGISDTDISSVYNSEATSGGYDEESDEDLLERYLEHVKNTATSGNPNHYKGWALEVSGVGKSKVFPLWNGNGTVKVVIVGSDGNPVNETLVTNTYNYIETQRPIGATVTVESATSKDITIEADVRISSNSNLADVVSRFEYALEQYRQDIIFNSPYVSYANISSMLLNADGCEDHSNLLLNSLSSNIDIGDKEVPIFTVTLREVV